MLKVLVADDHEVVRDGVRHVLSRELGAVHTAEAATADEALALLRAESFDLVILDIGLPGRSGLDLLADIRAARLRVLVLVFSAFPEEQLAHRALKAGASGYVAKGTHSAELLEAVRSLLNNGRHFGPAVSAMADDIKAGENPRLPHETLSAREYEVMVLLASGRTLSDISRELSISVKTVGTYHTRIMDKMGLGNNASLIAYAIRHGLC
ncbi:MAG: response regulator transcription factor [Armatimonadetes bacterium]|nr:response regulator transcription factor [Armatimonadota bacterium]